MTEPKTRKRPTTSGQPTPHAERQSRLGETRVDVYLPADAAEDFRLIVEDAAQELGLPLSRAKTQAIVRAVRERAARVRKKKKQGAC